MLNQEISIRQAFLYVVGTALLLLGFWAFTRSALWANIISPFDAKPEISFYEMTNNPERIEEYRANLCAWSKRELLRNPGFVIEAAKEAACKNAE
jgi:hypothetical protein